MPRQHLLTEFVLFAERYSFHPRPFKAKAETADPTKEIKDRQHGYIRACQPPASYSVQRKQPESKLSFMPISQG